MPAYSELTRRLGFEYNGMVLHEYYFGNMKQNGSGDPDKTSNFFKAAEASFGSYDIWKADFTGVGKMLRQSGERTNLEPLDHPARDRKRFRL